MGYESVTSQSTTTRHWNGYEEPREPEKYVYDPQLLEFDPEEDLFGEFFVRDSPEVVATRKQNQQEIEQNVQLVHGGQEGNEGYDEHQGYQNVQYVQEEQQVVGGEYVENTENEQNIQFVNGGQEANIGFDGQQGYHNGQYVLGGQKVAGGGYVENTDSYNFTDYNPEDLRGAIRSATRVMPRNDSLPFSVNRTGRANSYKRYLNDRNDAPNVRILELSLIEDEEPNTVNISERIAYELQTKKIKQSDFARMVLNRGQSTVSAMLNNPKHWTFLKDQAKDSYVKMLKWLRMSEEDQVKVLEGKINMEDKDSIEVSKKKRPTTTRTIFTKEQIQRLEGVFKETKFPDPTSQEMLAVELNVPQKAIRGFFQNARRKMYIKEKTAQTMEIYKS